MRSRTPAWAAVVLFTVVLPGRAADQSATLSDLSWISGCWEGRSEGRQFREQWMSPAGDAMLGMGHTTSSGKTVEYEFLMLRQQSDGIFYVAKPSGQAEASFKLVAREPRGATFENLQHDFPQRIIYRLSPDGALAARIEGMRAGSLQGIDYSMRKVTCP